MTLTKKKPSIPFYTKILLAPSIRPLTSHSHTLALRERKTNMDINFPSLTLATDMLHISATKNTKAQHSQTQAMEMQIAYLLLTLEAKQDQQRLGHKDNSLGAVLCQLVL